ncbi:MAG: hypothetical protein VKP72_13085 [bacterium]|nr:hypothetical protein [bacterium]
MSDESSLPRRIQAQAQVFAEQISSMGRTFWNRQPATRRERRLWLLPEGTMRLWARKVALALEPDVVLQLEDLVCDLVANDPMAPLRVEDPETYRFRFLSGRMRLSLHTLEVIMNRHVLPAAGYPLRDARLSSEHGRLVIRGVATWMNLPLPVTLETLPSVGDGGHLFFEVKHFAVRDVGVGGFLRFVGLDLESLVTLRSQGAFEIAGDHMRLDPLAVFTRPAAEGHPSEVLLLRDGLEFVYRTDENLGSPLWIDEAASSTLLGMGHPMEVGPMVLQQTHYQVVPLVSSDRLELSVPRHREQLAGGNSTLTRQDTLLIRMPSLGGL